MRAIRLPLLLVLLALGIWYLPRIGLLAEERTRAFLVDPIHVEVAEASLRFMMVSKTLTGPCEPCAAISVTPKLASCKANISAELSLLVMMRIICIPNARRASIFIPTKIPIE